MHGSPSYPTAQWQVLGTTVMSQSSCSPHSTPHAAFGSTQRPLATKSASLHTAAWHPPATRRVTAIVQTLASMMKETRASIAPCQSRPLYAESSCLLAGRSTASMLCKASARRVLFANRPCGSSRSPVAASRLGSRPGRKPGGAHPVPARHDLGDDDPATMRQNHSENNTRHGSCMPTPSWGTLAAWDGLASPPGRTRCSWHLPQPLRSLRLVPAAVITQGA